MKLPPRYVNDCSSSNSLDTPRKTHPILRYVGDVVLVLAAGAFACGAVSLGIASVKRAPAASVECCAATPHLSNTAAVQGQP